MNMSMTARVLILCACLLAGAGVVARGNGPVTIPPRESLASLPGQIGNWSGKILPDMSENARNMLQVTDYTTRLYINPQGQIINFYVGYHAAGGFHSPLNCLPGSGWIPVKKERLDFPVLSSPEMSGKESIHINRIVIVKGVEKQVVLYWYQGCGRVIASEYMGLLYGMVDKMQRGRTDAALVRIMSPAESLEPAAEEAASRNVVEFLELIYPLLSRYIPN